MIDKNVLGVIETANACHAAGWQNFGKRICRFILFGSVYKSLNPQTKEAIHLAGDAIGQNKGQIHIYSRKVCLGFKDKFENGGYQDEERRFHIECLDNLKKGDSFVCYTPNVFSGKKSHMAAGLFTLFVADTYNEGVKFQGTCFQIGSEQLAVMPFTTEVVFNRNDYLEPYLIDFEYIKPVKNHDFGEIPSLSRVYFNMAMLLMFFAKNPNINSETKNAKVFKGKTKPGKGKREHEFIFVGADWEKETVFQRSITVTGHWRNQPYGPGRTLRKRIWIEAFQKGDFKRRSGKEKATKKIRKLKRGQKIRVK